MILIAISDTLSQKNVLNLQLWLRGDLRIYDGNSSWNDLLAHAYDTDYGNVYNDIQIVASSGNNMYVRFSADSYVAPGFFAKIIKTPLNDKDPNATFCTITKPCKANEGHCYHDEQCAKGLNCGRNNCPASLGYANNTNCCYELCTQWLDLENGIITSPNYPNEYPPSTECSWTITALQNQIVRLQFEEFSVSCV